jgi:hypothetical protein
MAQLMKDQVFHSQETFWNIFCAQQKISCGIFFCAAARKLSAEYFSVLQLENFLRNIFCA